ncbi:unnamed protein product [Sympodiomycopsis kandeliae]
MGRGKNNKRKKAQKAQTATKSSTNDTVSNAPNASHTASNASAGLSVGASANSNDTTPPTRPRRPSESLNHLAQPSRPEDSMAAVAAEVAASQLERLNNIAKRYPSTAPTRRHKFKTKQPGAHLRTASADAISHLSFHQCDHESILPHQMAKVSKLLTKLFTSYFDHTVYSLYELNRLNYHASILQKVFLDFARRRSAPLPEDEPSDDDFRQQLEDACLGDDIPETAIRVSTEEVMDMLGDFAYSHDETLQDHGAPCACSFAKCCPCLENLVESMARCTTTFPDYDKEQEWPGERAIQKLSEIPDLPTEVAPILTRLGTALFKMINDYDPLQHEKVAEIRSLLLTMNPLDLYYQVLTRDLCVEPTDLQKTQCDEAKMGCLLPMLESHDDEDDELPDPEKQVNAHRRHGSHRTCGHSTSEKYAIRDGQLCLFRTYHDVKQEMTAETDNNRGSVKSPNSPSRRVRANTIIKDWTGFRFRKVAARTLSEHAKELVAKGAVLEAADLLKNAKSLDRREPVYVLNRAACMVIMNAFPSAIKECNEAIALDPHNERAHFRRGVCRVANNDRDGAMRDFSLFFKLTARSGSILTAIPALNRPEFRPDKAVDDLCEWGTGFDQPKSVVVRPETAASYLPRSTSDPNVSQKTPARYPWKDHNGCPPCSEKDPFAAHRASIKKILIRCMNEAGVPALVQPAESSDQGLGLSGLGPATDEATAKSSAASEVSSQIFDIATGSNRSPASQSTVMTPCTSGDSGQNPSGTAVDDGSGRSEDIHEEDGRSSSPEVDVQGIEKRRQQHIEHFDRLIFALYFGLQVFQSQDSSESANTRMLMYQALAKASYCRMHLVGEPSPKCIEIASLQSHDARSRGEAPPPPILLSLGWLIDDSKVNGHDDHANSKSGETATPAIAAREESPTALLHGNAIASSSKSVVNDADMMASDPGGADESFGSSTSSSSSIGVPKTARSTKPKRRLSAKAQGKQRQLDTDRPADSSAASKIQNLANRLPTKSSPPRPIKAQVSADADRSPPKAGTSTVSSTATVEVTGSVQRGYGAVQTEVEVSDVKITWQTDVADGSHKKMKKVKATKKI